MAGVSASLSIPKDALRGKTAVVTGASRGIGKATATVFARAGAWSIFIVRDRAVGEHIVAEAKRQGLQADFGVADVTDAAQVSMLALDLGQRHPTIDILVNNAGVLFDEDRVMRPSHVDPMIFEKTLNVNVLGPMRMCDAFLPLMPKGARIINVSSGLGQLAGESDGSEPCYSMSKTALNMFTQLLAADLRDRGIMVDAFDPGWVKTDMGGRGARIEPEDAAQTALFLASRPASTQTGLFWRRNQVIEW